MAPSGGSAPARLDLDAGQVGMHATEARQARADALDVGGVARGQRPREAVRKRGGLGLARVAVGVVDRGDRAVREKAAAGDHQEGDGGQQARLKSDAEESVARGQTGRCGHP